MRNLSYKMNKPEWRIDGKPVIPLIKATYELLNAVISCMGQNLFNLCFFYLHNYLNKKLCQLQKGLINDILLPLVFLLPQILYRDQRNIPVI